MRPAASPLLDILPADFGHPHPRLPTHPPSRPRDFPRFHFVPLAVRSIYVRGARNRSTSMRLIAGITFLLIGIGMLSCRVEGTANSIPQSPTSWVRTVDGWERPNLWHTSPAEPPRLHPAVVAAGQTLASLLALVVFRREQEST